MTLADEIERSWAQHRPEVPAAVWRQLRALKRELAPTATRIETMLGDDRLIRDLLFPLSKRRGIHRQRLLNDFRRALPGAEVAISHQSMVEAVWLSPSSAIIADALGGEAQNCLLANYLLAHPDFHIWNVRAAWALEISDHAASRFLQRAQKCDLRTAALSAARAFAAADAASVPTRTTIYLPAGPGCFVGHAIEGTTPSKRRYVYMRARTWIPAAWMRKDQLPLPAAAEPEKTVALALWRWDGRPKPALRLPPHTEEHALALGPVARPAIGGYAHLPQPRADAP